MNKPQVSVIIITYNQENYIKETLDGVLNQLVNFEYEIVIGDDCSKDRTREILNKYVADNDNIKLLLHPQN